MDLSAAEVEAAHNHLKDLFKKNGQLRGCTSYVQRQMGVGYNHASRLIGVLVLSRIISEPDRFGERTWLK